MFLYNGSLGTVLTNRNDVHDESRRRIYSGNACYYSIQKLKILTTLQNAEDQDVE
jgi:hypothetical protein